MIGHVISNVTSSKCATINKHECVVVRCGWEKLVLLLSVLTKQEIPQLIHSNNNKYLYSQFKKKCFFKKESFKSVFKIRH